MTTITPATVLRKNDGVFSGDVDGEIVAMNVQNGKYYHLNGTGSRIFALLEDPLSVQALCEKLQPRYRAGGEVLGRDVLEFVREMVDFGLIDAAG